ncbi:MAG: N-acetyl-gamma-glutamyl-phosphate reductase [Candidatus Omnitrophica bacterium]|nr:N-acetyl-gamma-glutamyl-phosphate reductase [Candidatus Omnitrophota bacterium]
MSRVLNVAVIGATGHTGEELVDVLLGHPGVRIKQLCNTSAKEQVFAEVFPRFQGRIALTCRKPDIRRIKEQCDLVFLALPHTVSMSIAPRLLRSGLRVIDLSADYRLRDKQVYEQAYGTKHKDAPYLKKAVYGLCELAHNRIRKAALVANPGCYPTAAILGLAPLCALGLADTGGMVIDAKSGVTGAGRKMLQGFLYAEVNEDFKAYKVDVHQHVPEIAQALRGLAGKKVSFTFVPHLLPLDRGILCTMYAPKSKAQITTGRLISLYRKFYKNEPFIRIKAEGQYPRIKEVARTHFCDIGIKVSREYVIVIAAIDNLGKGAAGQAVQNMNIMYGFPQTMGLIK